jgi:1-aminocyclopropane-1-carboxylate deaminase
MLVSNIFLNDEFASLDSLDDTGLGVSLQVLRLDSFCPEMSGNKFFKLKYNILHAIEHGYQQLLSFGGAYSNHIHALAMAGKMTGLKTIGIIRGERHEPLNPTLRDAEEAGMKLYFVSREEYRKRNDQAYLDEISQKYGSNMLIPEGGSNLLGIKGCREIIDHVHHHIGTEYDYLVLPCGTAATMAGVVAAVPEGKKVVGVSVLKAGDFLAGEVSRFLAALGVIDKGLWQIEQAYHCGGYAKVNQDLSDFVSDFEDKYRIALDHVYTGKCFLGLFDLIGKQVIPGGARVVAIHTGGMQGERGMQGRLAKLHVQDKSLAASI